MLIYEDPIKLAMLGAAARLLSGSCVYLCGFSSYLG